MKNMNSMPSFGLQEDLNQKSGPRINPDALRAERPDVAAVAAPEEDNASNNYGYGQYETEATAAPQKTFEKKDIDPTAGTEKKGLFDAGNKRFNSIATAAKSRFAKITGGIGRFFKGTQEVGKKVAVGVLSTPELASKAGEKLGQANEAVAGAMYKGYEATGEWVNETFGGVANAMYDGIENVQNFAAEKASQLAAFAKSEVETFKTAKDAIAKGTVEALMAAKKSIAEDATNLFNYGRKAIGNFYHKQVILAEVRFSKMNDERIKALEFQIEQAKKEKAESKSNAVSHLMRMKGKHTFMKQAQLIKLQPAAEGEQFAQAA